MSIESVSLYFKAGTSDKIYNATIEEKDNGYVVNFSYGRRGSALKSGTKTNCPVSREDAKKIFDSIVKEKTGKGYRSLEKNENQIIHVPENLPDTTVEIKCVLLNSIQESDVEKYIKSDNWYMQRKYDGVRFMLTRKDKKVNSYNRKGKYVNIPISIWNPFQNFEKDFLLDGELIGDNYFVFDILEYDNLDLREISLDKRIKYLDFFKNVCENLKIADTYSTFEEKNIAYKHFVEQKEEGVVFKNKTAKYYIGRPASAGDYLKFKFYETCSCLVTEINDKKRSVHIGLFKGQKLKPAGKVTIPVNHDVPEVGSIIEVRYLYAYKQSGNLYQPTYLGLRQDIQDNDCNVSQLKYKKEEED